MGEGNDAVVGKSDLRVTICRDHHLETAAIRRDFRADGQGIEIYLHGGTGKGVISVLTLPGGTQILLVHGNAKIEMRLVVHRRDLARKLLRGQWPDQRIIPMGFIHCQRRHPRPVRLHRRMIDILAGEKEAGRDRCGFGSMPRWIIESETKDRGDLIPRGIGQIEHNLPGLRRDDRDGLPIGKIICFAQARAEIPEAPAWIPCRNNARRGFARGKSAWHPEYRTAVRQLYPRGLPHAAAASRSFRPRRHPILEGALHAHPAIN